MRTRRPLMLILMICVCLNDHTIAQGNQETSLILIRNCTVTDVVNKKVTVRKNILIKGRQIVSITDKVPIVKAHTTIDGSGLVALPGFVNTHTHLWQHIAKAAYPKGNLQEWVRIYRIIHSLDSVELYKVVKAACKEALLSGITTVSDYASLSFNDYGFGANARAIKDAGIDGVLVWNNPSFFLPDSIKKKEIIRQQKALGKQFPIWMGPGAMSFYPISQVYAGILIATQLNMPITEHVMENMQEQRSFYDTTRWYYNTYAEQLSSKDKEMLARLLHMKRPSPVDGFENISRDAKLILQVDSLQKSQNYPQLLSESDRAKLSSFSKERLISQIPLYEYFNVLQNFLAIHAVWLQAEDIAIAGKYMMSVSHNPESNLYLSSGMAPMYEYLHEGMLVTLGTDGAASNDGINFFSAMKAMWNMYKIRLLNANISGKLDEWEILRAATINGAKALGMDAKTGSIEVGKEADILLVSTRDLGMSPFNISRLIALLVYSADTRNVKHVISNGKLMVNNGRLIGTKEIKLSEELTTIASAGEKRMESGKLWTRTYSLTQQSVPDYWFKYRSIRISDSVYVTIKNNTHKQLRISIMTSAATFGGGQPVVASQEVKDRFPLNQDPFSFSESITILNGEEIQVVKTRGNYNIQITHNGNIKKKVTKSGQLLVLAEKN